MGGRLSMPKGPDGMSEISKPTSGTTSARLSRNRGIINGRTLMAPFAAITMAGLLFIYARTSIRAAKLNAQKHREADGGQISWHKESMRRHGTMERLDDDRGTFRQALMADVGRKKGGDGEGEGMEGTDGKEGWKVERSGNDAELRKIMGKRD